MKVLFLRNRNDFLINVDFSRKYSNAATQKADSFLEKAIWFSLGLGTLISIWKYILFPLLFVI